MNDVLNGLKDQQQRILSCGGDTSFLDSVIAEIEMLRGLSYQNVFTQFQEKSEARLQQDIRVRASQLGHRLYRNNSGALPDEKGNFIRFGLGNDSKKLNTVFKSSDLIGHTKTGKFLACEIKAPGWKMIPSDKRAKAQANFMNSVILHGGIAGFIQSIEDFERLVENE